MKLLSAVLMLIASMTSFASSETKTFMYDGSQDSIEMVLRADKTHTEYRYEQRREICYRQEVIYVTHCQSTPQGRFCQQVPRYRTISYPCMRTVTIPYEVFDYHVMAEVNVKINDIQTNLPIGEKINVTLNGDVLTLSATGSKNFFVIQKMTESLVSMNGSMKTIDAFFRLDLEEAQPVIKALSMSNISMKDSMLTFTTGPVAVRDVIGFSLNVEKAPLVGSDTVLFNRELKASEVSLNAQETSSVATVDLQKLGVKLESGRHTLTAKTFFKYTGKILNASQFETTEASRTLIYKVR